MSDLADLISKLELQATELRGPTAAQGGREVAAHADKLDGFVAELQTFQAALDALFTQRIEKLNQQAREALRMQPAANWSKTDEIAHYGAECRFMRAQLVAAGFLEPLPENSEVNR